MVQEIERTEGIRSRRVELLQSDRVSRSKQIASLAGRGLLLAFASSSAAVVLFIFYFIVKDAVPFFRLEGFTEFLTQTGWYPSREPAEFGALAIFVGSGLVTLCSILFAVPLGIAAAVCLSDILPFRLRQLVKPLIEVLAAIPSVAYGFVALVIFAPILQQSGGPILAILVWCVGLPTSLLLVVVLVDLISNRAAAFARTSVKGATGLILLAGGVWGLHGVASRLSAIQIASGTNALNVSLILGIMALPTIVSVSEDALQSVGHDLREGSHALGATRAETILHVVLPAAASGIMTAVILGLMRVMGETMVVWMASGNAPQIPTPWYNLFEPVRTLTATIAGDMGEADHVTGSSRYHVLYAMAFCLLAISFSSNLASEWILHRSHHKKEG